ncbi:3-methyl-2-oxobutanoate dehydrogenase subunit VorB [Sinanaerobacter chloroacetimidivorans]|uniref:3-methyl-2-oxobutanoate dehydrogenase subunit VorB n=1 Tax=Sinanaerobacter chloroacetimidivorans TaxID=2818044 RepID=A0A8J7W505_9FIRM|nr:3-methyl-2-oxobutanoate dehydrogenase subunit VorB [Sinanaerobacter chloroacetimidivorans]MBR0599146.1 3-methyl-2-oxobutanoate dehydrogenase subunit VorB [Sinanaerobacter chloroacetimidivorans]
MKKQLMKGNDAIAEAAVRAGCRFFSGYPITPQSEILEYLSWRLPEVGGTFIQSESELSGISMVYGAAATGARAMTSSSGPGFSLLQEGISYIASAELPCLIVDVMRYGSGLADIFTGQGDYWQAVKNGGHGDYRCIVYAPNSVQESADLVALAFDKAEEYRNPVILLSDASISQMMEPVGFPELKDHDMDQYDWALRGKGNGPNKRHTSVMYYNPDYDNYLKAKYDTIAAKEQRWEEYQTEDAELILVAYGISSRICEEVVDLARAKGQKVGLIRPITLYPFPVTAFQKLKNVKAYASVEMSCLSQMIEDVALTVRGAAPVYPIRGGMKIYEASDICHEIDEILAGHDREVY